MIPKRIAMLISNGYGPDVRVHKEAHTLSLAGYKVTVLAWDRTRSYPPHEIETTPPEFSTGFKQWAHLSPQVEPVSIVRIHVPAGYRTGRALLKRIPAFWWHLLNELRRARPALVCAHDLDTLPAAYLYHRLTGTPVLYDAREYYPGMVQANVGSVLSAILERLEQWFVPRVGGVVTVGERLAARHRALKGRVWIVPNSHLLPNPAMTEQAHANLRTRFGIPAEDLVITYVGMLAPDRLLAPILDAVREDPHAWLVVGGDGPLKSRVQAAADACSRIIPLGWLPLRRVPAVVASADIVYYGLNSSNPNSFYFMPNLAFFALAAGRPILTTPVGEIADFVQKNGCGVVMEQATAEAAGKALRQYHDAAYRGAVTEQARRLGSTTYNWQHAANELLKACQSLNTI